MFVFMELATTFTWLDGLIAGNDKKIYIYIY